jgi:hypothetical protein
MKGVVPVWFEVFCAPPALVMGGVDVVLVVSSAMIFSS